MSKLHVFDKKTGERLCSHTFDNQISAERAVWHYQLEKHKAKIYWKVEVEE